MDDKYITFKRADFEELADDYTVVKDKNKFNKIAYEKALGDSVVIRLRDTFAAAALHTYANSIAITARTLGELAPQTRDRLQGIADYFHRMAVKADDTQNKLPD